MPDNRDAIVLYHERTKHHLSRYAAGPGQLDWATQPDPFRRYADSEHLPLALAADRIALPFSALHQACHVSPSPLDREHVGILFELSMALSAWKAVGQTRWALRCNPSSGNLHPTEAYLVCPDLPDLPSGIYHYLSLEHLLETRARPGAGWNAIWPGKGVLLGLSSIHWREAWKYGERAYRYCQHDAGHALAALRYAAATLGWQARLLDLWGDADIAALLGLDRVGDFADAEREARTSCSG